MFFVGVVEVRYGAVAVLVVGVVVVCVPAGVGDLGAEVVDVDVLVVVVGVDSVLVTVAVGDVVVTVVVGAVVVTVVVEVDFLLTVEVAPKNVVGCPLPVIDFPASRSGTVKMATTIANASSPVTMARRQRGRQ